MVTMDDFSEGGRDDFNLRLRSVPQSLDSSQLLHPGNYSGKIREVALMEGTAFFYLHSAQSHAREKGFTCYDLGIVNVIHGAPAKNEPRSALLFKGSNDDLSDIGSCLADALIVRSAENMFSFYQLGAGFRYIS